MLAKLKSTHGPIHVVTVLLCVVTCLLGPLRNDSRAQSAYVQPIPSSIDDDPIQAELQFQRTVTSQLLGDTQQPESIRTASLECPDRCLNCGTRRAGSSCRHCRDGSNQARNWNFAVLFANEYDSNLPSAPDFEGLGSIADKEDLRFVIATFGDMRLWDCDWWNLGLVGSTLNAFHYEQDEFNLEDYMGGAYSNAVLADGLIASVRYEFHETRLNEEHLASDHRLTPNMSVLWRERGHTTIYYEYSTASLNTPALIPAQVQSGDVNSFGVTQAFYTFGGDGRLYFGYRYESAETDGTDFDRASNMVTARIERPLACGWIGDAEFRHFWDDYHNPNSLDFFGRPREDTRAEVRAGLQKNLNQRLSFRFDYTFVKTNSNVENLFGVNFYEFDRHIVSTQMIFNF